MRRLIATVLFLLPTLAFAQRSGIELTPMVGYRWGGTIAADRSDLFGQDVQVANSASYGIALDVPLTYDLQFELMANHQSSSFETEDSLFDGSNRIADVDLTYYQAGLLWQLGGPDIKPYVTLSAGVANIDPDVPGARDANKFSGTLGGGVKMFFADNIAFRLEGRGYWTNIDSGNNNDCFRCDYNPDKDFYQGEASVGLSFRF